MSDSQPLAYCQDGHKLAWLMPGERGREIHYWAGVAGLALRSPDATDNGHFNYAPHESVVPLLGAERGRREVMCHHGHGGEGEMDLADLLPVIAGKSKPLVIRV